ncbi:MAG: hypothetical protein FWD59_03190 [Micrococcales bacterium]|nr:hypothetical protein [Micrococcales bacterium]
MAGARRIVLRKAWTTRLLLFAGAILTLDGIFNLWLWEKLVGETWSPPGGSILTHLEGFVFLVVGLILLAAAYLLRVTCTGRKVTAQATLTGRAAFKADEIDFVTVDRFIWERITKIGFRPDSTVGPVLVLKDGGRRFCLQPLGYSRLAAGGKAKAENAARQIADQLRVPFA